MVAPTVKDMTKLASTWEARDLPVLSAAADRLDRLEIGVQSEALAEDSGLDRDDVMAALLALAPEYLDVKPIRTLGGLMDVFAVGLTERGRRAVGLWPSGEGVDALLDALRQAEEATTDPEERTLIRRAMGALGSVSRTVLSDVLAAVVQRQMGM